MFLYSGNELEMLRLLEFLVRALLPDDLRRLFGSRSRKVCFRTPDVYVVFNRTTGEFIQEKLQLSAVRKLQTALVLPGGLLMVKHVRGWKIYDPRTHRYYPECYQEKPRIYSKLQLPVFFLEWNGRRVLMNGLTGRQYWADGKMKIVSPIHITLEQGGKQWLFDLQTMHPVRVREYVTLTSRFSSFLYGGRKYLLDGETGELCEFDDIVVSPVKLSRHLLYVNGEVVGHVEGTILSLAHPAHPACRGVRH